MTGVEMQPMKRWINFAQIFAALCLGISCFLPFYQSQGRNEVHYATEAWFLFFWTLPVIFILYKLSNRWLKAILCVLSSIGGVLALFMLSFLAYFKSDPLIGFQMARISLYILIACWLLLSVMTLWTTKTPRAKTSAQG
jgi:hypothetical protein